MKPLLFLLPIYLLTACSVPNNFTGSKPTPVANDETKAVLAAKKLYEERKGMGDDFSNGQCLANDIIPDWSADIAHQPRLPIDDDVTYQCAAFREGKTHHFLELDPNGNFLRAY